MASPNYQAVKKNKFVALIEEFKTAPKARLVIEMRALFDDAKVPIAVLIGKLVYLKKDDTLALADRLQADETHFSLSTRANYVEMLESLKE